MGSIIQRGVNPTTFLRDAKIQGFGMQEGLIDPNICSDVSWELEEAGYLVDYTEQVPVKYIADNNMRATRLLHSTIERLVGYVEDDGYQHLPLFSVRIFEPGEHSTTIHRNHSSIGPWAIGITLAGEASFQVYDQNVLDDYWDTMPLVGDGNDPTPIAEMGADAGSAWTLYTENEQLPHSGGLVTSTERRELLIFYSMNWLNQ